MDFTIAEMRKLHAKYGNALVIFDNEGNGPFSADPQDYFYRAETDRVEGDLQVRIPESFVPVEDLEIPESA